MQNRDDEITRIVRCLCDGDGNHRNAADMEVVLAEMRNLKSSDILELFAHPLPEVRFRLAWLLGQIGDDFAMYSLLCMCTDEDERVRYDAMQSLGILRNANALTALARMYLRFRESDEVAASSALTAINRGRLKDSIWTEAVLSQAGFDSVLLALDDGGGCD